MITIVGVIPDANGFRKPDIIMAKRVAELISGRTAATDTLMRIPLHHLDLNVTDLPRSRAFYERVLSRIGYRRVDYNTPGEPQGFDWLAAGSGRFSIGLYRAQSEQPHDRHGAGVHHVALAAPSREAVDELHRLLLEMGARILDPPREYPNYEPGYYAVFFLDPDGIKLEYVFTP